MKYKCVACGYIYDDNVESVKFADLPLSLIYRVVEKSEKSEKSERTERRREKKARRELERREKKEKKEMLMMKLLN